MIPPLVFILALVQVESGGDDFAVGQAGELGPLQIKPCVVEDVNRFVRVPNFYKLSQRTNRAISMQILRRYLHRYASVHLIGRKVTLKDMALIWHFGPSGWSNRSHEGREYWKRVQKAMAAQPTHL